MKSNMRAIGTFLQVIAYTGIVACGDVVSGPSRDAPVLESLSPESGSIEGGTQVTITGRNFAAGGESGNTIIVVGGRQASDVMVISDTQLTFTTPRGDIEGASVEVTASTTTGFGTLPDAFTYNIRPSVLSVTPAIGKRSGGTAITIKGRGFMAGTPVVTIAGAAATDVAVVDDQTITATTPVFSEDTRAFTPLDIEVRTDNGAGTLPASFRLTAPGLLVIDRETPSRIFHVDTATGITTFITAVTGVVRACATHPATGVVYAKRNDAAVQERQLVTLDPLTGESSLIGPIVSASGNHDVASLTFVGNTLYGLDSHGGPRGKAVTNRLITINTTTAGASVIGAAQTLPSRYSGIAVKDANTVYLVTATTASLDTMATATSAKSVGLALTGAVGSGGVTPAIVNVGTDLYVLEYGNTVPIIYKLNADTGVLSKFAQVNASQAMGMCATPSSF